MNVAALYSIRGPVLQSGCTKTIPISHIAKDRGIGINTGRRWHSWHNWRWGLQRRHAQNKHTLIIYSFVAMNFTLNQWVLHQTKHSLSIVRFHILFHTYTLSFPAHSFIAVFATNLSTRLLNIKPPLKRFLRILYGIHVFANRFNHLVGQPVF